MRAVRNFLAALTGLAAILALCGCPGAQAPVEFVAGGTGEPLLLAARASAEVFSPQSDLAISGGTPVEVNWRAIGTRVYAVVDVFLDRDNNPDNNNEIIALNNVALTETTTLLDTTPLQAGSYLIGVRVKELGEVVAYGYAPGQLTINQAPTLFFSSPRDNVSFDRTPRVNPTFDVAWTVNDPDSLVTVRIYLDPDNTPNGNEVLLRKSNSQTGDSFSFDFPTANFDAGTYRILALVSDGVTSVPFYAPASIKLRSRLAGYIDLRDMHLPSSSVRGAVFEGFNPRDNAGSFVSSIGDIDHDGFDDFVLLAQFGKPQYIANFQRTGVGEAYLIYGRSDPFSGVINLNSTGTLFRGEICGGVPEVADPIRPSRGITSCVVLTDWDSDGVRELAFGVPFTDSRSVEDFTPGIVVLDQDGYFRTGAVIVMAGSVLRPDLGFPGRNVMNLAEFGTLAHEPWTQANCAEGFYGPKAPSFGLFGPSTLFHRHLATVVGTPNDGSVRLGTRLSSNEFGDQFGETVAAWDFDALVISAPNRDPQVCIENVPSVPGSGVISAYFCDLKSGFYLWSNVQAPPANSTFNYPGSVQSAGYNTIPHGGPYHYILDDLRIVLTPWGFGTTASPGYFVDPDDAEPCGFGIDPRIDSPGNSVRFWSDTPGARLSNAKGLGDFNADGLLDLTIGAPLSKESRGVCYIVLGRLRDLVRGGELRLEELGLPMDSANPLATRIFDGIRVVGNLGERLGQSQDSAGDFNGDGLADVVIGSPLLNNRQGGAAVFFGSRDVINLTQDDIPFNAIATRGLGVVFTGEEDGDLAGARVAGVSDMDGDGLDDILIAAPNRSVRLDIDLDGTVEIDREFCGVVYLIYGSANLRGTISLSQVGTAQLPGAVFIGRNTDDQLGAGLGEHADRGYGIAGAGDVDGDGRGDILLGSVRASPRNRERAGEAYLLYGAGEARPNQ